MHLELSLQNVLVLLTIQLTVFGWRINREMKLAEQKRRIWLPINDILNVIGGFAVLAVCIILPLSCTSNANPAYQFPRVSNAVFAAAIVLLAFYPVAMIAHYGLLNKGGRDGFLEKYHDYPYCPLQEMLVYIVTALSAALAFVLVLIR